MGHGDRFRYGAAAAVGVAGIVLGSQVANADMPLTAAFQQGKVLIDVRAREEMVDDETAAKDANAGTVRARLGFETGYWNDFSALFEFDAVRSIGADRYNSTRNGRTSYAMVADPEVTELNRLSLSYAAPFDNKITVGRQRLILGNARFVGNVGWRQHEQTFDAVTLVNTMLEETTFTYAYVTRVNRVFGSDTPVPDPASGATSIGHYDSKSHLINAAYEGLPHLRFEGYAYLLDLEQSGTVSTATPAAFASTATYGGRIDAFFKVGDLKPTFAAEYAHQTDYADNPKSIGLNYWLGEAALGYGGFTGTLGYEVMGGNGTAVAATAATAGFATPLATLHAFDGWADKFLATPAMGIEDFYVKAAYTAESVLCFSKVTPTIVYHDFKGNRVNTDLGSEWDASLDLVLDKNVSFNLKYAAYDGTGVGTLLDKNIGWLSATYKF